MKPLSRFVVVAIMVLASTVAAYAGGPADKTYVYNRPLAEENLLIGVASDNLGLRLSAASILAEVGTSKSVVPLMAMLHKGSVEERIVAALALSKISDARGQFAVERAAMFDPSKKVQMMAAWYYNEYSVPKAEVVAPAFSSLSWINDVAPYPENFDGSDQGGISR